MSAKEHTKRIRRWSRLQNVAIALAVIGFALPVTMIVVLLLVPALNSDQSIGPLIGVTMGGGVALLIVAAVLETEAQSRLRNARFAAGRTSAGRVELVDEEPSTEVGGFTTYTLMIVSDAPGRVKLHRRLFSSHYPPDARVQVGQIVLFRHAGDDPDDLDDIRFVRFAGLDPAHRG